LPEVLIFFFLFLSLLTLRGCSKVDDLSRPRCLEADLLVWHGASEVPSRLPVGRRSSAAPLIRHPLTLQTTPAIREVDAKSLPGRSPTTSGHTSGGSGPGSTGGGRRPDPGRRGATTKVHSLVHASSGWREEAGQPVSALRSAHRKHGGRRPALNEFVCCACDSKSSSSVPAGCHASLRFPPERLGQD